MADSPRIEELKRRVKMDPASIAFAALAEEYRRTGRYEEAIEICRRGLQRHASYISAHVTLGRALMEVGRHDEARQELEYVLSVAPENLAAIRGLAEIHGRQGHSSDHADLTAGEMADMLAPRQPIPVEAVQAEKPETAETAETAEKPETAETAEKAEKPETAEKTETAEKVEAAEKTETAENTETAEEARPAEWAETAEKVEAETVEPRRPIDTTPMADEGTIELEEFESIDLSSLVELLATVEATSVVAPPPAASVAVSTPELPKVDPALERLETLLEAILQARETAGRCHVA